MSARQGAVGRLWARFGRTLQLIRVLAPREIRLRYRQSALDIVWAVVAPVVVMATYGYILTRGFAADMSCGPYATSAWAGLVLWTYFATAVGSGVTSLVSSSDLVTKLYFPREALPLASSAAALPELAIGIVTVFVVGLVQGVRFGVHSVAMVLPLAVLVIWAAAVATATAVLATFVRDVTHIVHLALRVGFFATPIMYDSSFLPGPLERLSVLNPVAVSVEGTRDALFCRAWPEPSPLLLQLAAGAAVLLAAIVYTRSVESRIADVV